MQSYWHLWSYETLYLQSGYCAYMCLRGDYCDIAASHKKKFQINCNTNIVCFNIQVSIST